MVVSVPVALELPEPPWALAFVFNRCDRMFAEKHADACAITIHVMQGSSSRPVGNLVFVWT